MPLQFHLIRHDKKDPLSGLTMHHYRHNSGFGLTHLPKPGFSKKFLGILVPCGASTLAFRAGDTETTYEVPPGTAHLLEHVVFRRGVHDNPESSLLARLSALGLEANAYTAHDHTLFYFTGVESLLSGLKVLLDAVRHPDINDQAVEIERRIIHHEIGLFYDEPEHLLFREIVQNLFVAHPARHDLTGTPEDIDRIQTAHLQHLHEVMYRQHGLHMIVAGDVDGQLLTDTLGPLLEDLTPCTPPEILTPEEPLEAQRASSQLEAPIVNPLFAVAWKDPAVRADTTLTGSRLLLRRLAGRLYFDMIFGKSSSFVETLLAEGIVDESFGYAYVCESDCAYLVLYGEALDPERTLAMLLNRLPAYIQSERWDETAFEYQRRAALGAFIRSMDDIDACGFAAVSATLSGLDLFDIPPLYERAELYRSAETLNFITQTQGRTTVIIQPSARH